MKRFIIILVALLSLFPCVKAGERCVRAGEVSKGLSVEQEQQFRYYWYAARQALEQQRYADAYALLQFCEAIDPDDGQTLTYLGILYQGIGDQERAQEAFEKAYRISPNDYWQRYLEPRKIQFIEQKKWKEALKIQDEIDRRKGEYDAYSALDRYRICAMWGKPKKAIAAIDKYLDTDPMNYRFLLFRLELLEQTNAKPKELYALYDRILEIDPYNLMVLNNYAYHLATHKGDLAKAEKMSQVTIREAPTNPVYLDTYGWIMHLQGQDELARFYLEKAAQYADDNSRNTIMEHLIKVTK